MEAEIGVGNLHDYGARWYDASIGRFTTVDPLASDYSFQSPYAYATNNPVLFRDIMGMGVTDWFRNRRTGEYQWFDREDNSFSEGGDDWDNFGEDFSIEKGGLQTNYRSGGVFDHFSSSPSLEAVVKDKAVSVSEMYWDWEQGTGPEYRHFFNNSISYAFQDAYSVNKARDLWYHKASIRPSTTSYKDIMVRGIQVNLVF